jgi:hypothetical protein
VRLGLIVGLKFKDHGVVWYFIPFVSASRGGDSLFVEGAGGCIMREEGFGCWYLISRKESRIPRIMWDLVLKYSVGISYRFSWPGIKESLDLACGTSVRGV